MSDPMLAVPLAMLSSSYEQSVLIFPEVIRLVVMMYVRYSQSLRNVEDLLAERAIDISTRPFGSGGIDLAQCSPPSSARDA
jgi:hypothetical protein